MDRRALPNVKIVRLHHLFDQESKWRDYSFNLDGIGRHAISFAP